MALDTEDHVGSHVTTPPIHSTHNPDAGRARYMVEFLP